MFKRITALLLSASILLTFASCSDNQPTDVNDQTQDTPQMSDTSENNDGASENKLFLSNPNPSEEAVRLYNYICDTYRSGIISGQQESSYSDGANARLYKTVVNVVGEDMPVCFHEFGRIPAVKELRDRKVYWVWFMIWHTDHITGSNDTGDLNEIYNDDYVITLDELPDGT